MLQHWWIENFKSFSGRTKFDLTGLNVFAGANSSGKSTIIQSMLLIKQTLQYAPAARALALNGPLLKLGTFSDVKNVQNDADYIGIGWNVDATGRYDNSIEYGSSLSGQYYPYLFFGRRDLDNICVEAKWTVGTPAPVGSPIKIGDELRNLHPSLLSSLLDVQVNDDSRKRTITSRIYIERGVTRPSGQTPSISPSFSHTVRELDDASREEIIEDRPDPNILGCNVTHFLPGQFGVEYDAEKLRVRRIINLLTADYRFGHERGIAPYDLPTRVITVVIQWLNSSGAPQKAVTEVSALFNEPTADRFEKLQQIFGRLRQDNQFSSNSFEPNKRTVKLDFSDLASRLDTELLKDVEIAREVAPTFTRRGLESTEFLRVFFTSFVRYLGPLRDEPRPVYPLEALANPTDVGFRGEHTAAVLDLNRERRVRYVPSSVFGLNKIAKITQSKSLHDAVVDWLTYVGVAYEVTTTDKGTFGHQMQVQTGDGSVYHDLTNVGVGVSQVLPIIVTALLAPVHSLLIFEQPELHLHPKVQARLADFFLSISLNEKQCIIETHSEYLVDRLRLRVAQAEGESIRSLINLYFTERLKGCTTCRKVEISEYGAIIDWPEDFFDQSQKEIEAILDAAAEKLARRRETPR